jgi:DNA polymerase-3 subunit delta'
MSFRDVLGQEKAVALLSGAISKGRISHAYLFTGPAGVGKAFTALNFIKALNCLSEGERPCDACRNCLKVDDGNMPDVTIIRSSSEKIKIAQIRQIQNALSLKAYEAKVKAVMLEDADRMTEDAANAFLKTLEEPQPDSVIVLTSAGEGRILPTVKSRCQIIRFGKLDVESLKKYIMNEYDAQDKTAETVAALSEGSIGRARDFMDSRKAEIRNRIMDEFLRRGPEATGERGGWLLSASRTGLSDCFDILFCLYRDMAAAKITSEERVFLNKDRVAEIISRSEDFTMDQLQDGIKKIRYYKNCLDRHVNPKFIADRMIEKLI